MNELTKERGNRVTRRIRNGITKPIIKGSDGKYGIVVGENDDAFNKNTCKTSTMKRRK